MDKQPKRINFISIQHGHTISCEGYHQPYVRTGYEQVLAQRTTDMFAVSAKEDGKVLSVDKYGMVVEYVSGERKGIKLGRVHGKAEGSVYPHDITTTLKANDTFIKSDILAYNTGFFEPDFMNPKNVIWKTSLTVKTALLETGQTDEDSTAISTELSDKLATKTTKVRSFVVNFKQGVHELKKPGTVVSPTDVLMILEDEITNDTGIFDDDSIQSLKKFANLAPKAKVNGIIDKVEVFYHGSKDDMSPSLRALANTSDREIAASYRSIGVDITNGSVTDEYRVEGNPLQLDTAEIKIYVTVRTITSTGDKLVFSNQLKSTVCETMDYDMHCEDGSKILALFGYKSVGARILVSSDLLGTTTTLLKLIGKKAVEIYNK